jgi:hypothetical protein
MDDVILDEKAERDRCVVAHDAGCLQPVLGDAINDSGKDLVLRLPPAKERFPGLTRITVRGYPRILRILGTGVRAIRRGAHKALAVVGRRVEKVAYDLFARPAADTPGRACQGGIKSEEFGVDGVQFRSEVLGKRHRHSQAPGHLHFFCDARIVLSHPSRKNKNAARVGHPDSTPYLKRL